MDLILHLGAHRTGSTAIERSLTINADLLRGEGLAIWAPKYLRDLRHFSRVNVVGTPQDAAATELAVAFAGVADSGAARLFMSEENMIGLMDQNLRRRSFYGDAAARLSRYAAILPRPPVRVALAVRSYASYWRSVYVYVLRRRELPTFGDLAGALAGARHGWLDLVDAAAAAFPGAEILVWPQETLDRHLRETAARVISRAAGADGLAPVPRRVNAGQSPGDIPLIFQVREHEPLLVRRELDKRLAKLRKPARKRAGAAPLFTPAQEALMARRYSADLAALAAGHGGARLLRGANLAGAGT